MMIKILIYMKGMKRIMVCMVMLAGLFVWFSCKKDGGENDGADGGANHNVGNNCLVCHKAGGGGDGIFTAGGSVFKAGTTTGATGAVINLYPTSDLNGTPVATMTSAVGGNFYTKSAINFGTGLYVKITYNLGSVSMSQPLTSGACNSCHGVSVGKITVN